LLVRRFAALRLRGCVYDAGLAYRKLTLETASQYLAKGEQYAAFIAVYPNLGKPEIQKPYLDLLKNDPGFDNGFRIEIGAKLGEIRNMGVVPLNFRNQIAKAAEVGLISAADRDRYIESIEFNVAQAVNGDGLKAEFGNLTKNYPALLKGHRLQLDPISRCGKERDWEAVGA